MPNLAVVLKEETRRLARKEVKPHFFAAKRTAIQMRREITRLKRAIDLLTKRTSYLESVARNRGGDGSDVQGEGEKQVRFSPRWIKKHRDKLRLSAADYGKLVGVSGQTVYHWEQGKSRPRRSQLVSLQKVRTLGRRVAVGKLSDLEAPKRRGRPARKPR